MQPLTFAHKTLLWTTLSVVILTAGVLALPGELIRREILRKTEKELRVRVDASFGTIFIGKGESNKIVLAEYWKSEKDKQKFDMSYEIVGDRGELTVELNESKRRTRRRDDESQWREYSADDRDWDDSKWSLRLTDALPIDLNVSLGAGKGEFDLTGLRIRTLKISSGASSAELRCDKPNAIIAETIVIESGVSKFEASDLSNINFRRLKFSGGVGAYKLDFGGQLRQSAEASVEVGLGAISLYIPRGIPTRILYDDSWFSHIDLDDSYSKVRSGVYETESYRNADKRLTLRVEAGLGSVKVRVR